MAWRIQYFTRHSKLQWTFFLFRCPSGFSCHLTLADEIVHRKTISVCKNSCCFRIVGDMKNFHSSTDFGRPMSICCFWFFFADDNLCLWARKAVTVALSIQIFVRIGNKHNMWSSLSFQTNNIICYVITQESYKKKLNAFT